MTSQLMKTTMIEQLPPAEYESVQQESLAFVERLTNAEAFPALAASFGAELPADFDTLDIGYKLSLLRAFTVTHLDVRRHPVTGESLERWQVGKIEYAPAQEEAIAKLTVELGMQGETYAQSDSYDAAKVPGGRAVGPDGTAATGSVALRVDKLAREVERGVQVPYIILQGSARPLDAKERQANPGAATEFDALCLAFEERFGIERGVNAEVEDFRDVHHSPHQREAWKIRHYELADGTHAFAVSAPAHEGKDRANTADTDRFIQALLSQDMLPRGSILSVTTDLYVPFQQADALRQLGLPMDVKVETIGYGGVDRPASSYAAEINSAVKQAHLLYEALLARQTGLEGMAGAYNPDDNPELHALLRSYKLGSPVGRRNHESSDVGLELRPEALVVPVPNMDELRRRKQAEGYGSIPIDEHSLLFNEALTSIADLGIAGQSYYSRPNAGTGEPVAGVDPNVYIRHSVAQKLADIDAALQQPGVAEFFGGAVRVYVEDGLRPLSLQRHLYDEVFPRLIREQHSGIDDDAMVARRSELIAKPSEDPRRPSPHATGGAFDVKLVYVEDGPNHKAGDPVEMGHADGETSQRVNPDYYETHEPRTEAELVARRNRRAFYAIMTGTAFGTHTGFANNPTEWWHWGSGDQLSAFVLGQPNAVYSFAEPITPGVDR